MISIIPVHGLPEIREGDDLAAMIVELDRARGRRRARDRAEGGLEGGGSDRPPRRLEASEPCDRAGRRRARPARDRGDPRRGEADHPRARPARDRRDPARVHLRVGGRRPLERAEPGMLVLLPVDPDASARRIRERVLELTGRTVGVVITDSFGRPFRQGTTDVAIGVAGIPAIVDLRGTKDRIGYELRASRTAIADEIAAAVRPRPGQGRRRPGRDHPRPPARRGRNGAGDRDRARARPVRPSKRRTTWKPAANRAHVPGGLVVLHALSAGVPLTVAFLACFEPPTLSRKHQRVVGEPHVSQCGQGHKAVRPCEPGESGIDRFHASPPERVLLPASRGLPRRPAATHRDTCFGPSCESRQAGSHT